MATITMKACAGGLPRLGMLAVLAMLAALPKADAAPLIDESMFSFAGFGTLGKVHSNQKNTDYVLNTIRKPSGPGRTSASSAAVDSNLGLQLMFNRDALSAVVQVVAEQRADNTNSPEIEWANVQYGFTPNLSARVGRIVLPTFLMSEHSKVGYANTMVRVPIDVYGALPITNSDGMDVTYSFNYRNLGNTTTIHYGQTKALNVTGSMNEGKKMMGIANNLEYGPYKFHLGYNQFDMYAPGIEQNPMLLPFRHMAHSKVKATSVGVAYEKNNLMLATEMSIVDIVLLGKKRGWYLTGGYRLHTFTPYVAYSAQSQMTQPGIPMVYKPADQKTAIVGVRWDFYNNTDLKLQFEQIRTPKDGEGAFKTYPGNQKGTTTNLISVAVDFVF